MEKVLKILAERGLIKQQTHLEELELQLNRPTTIYAGFDPTGDSLHVGHMLPLMALAHLQRAGHRVIALVGGGTAMIPDPTGKTELRSFLTREEIDHNARGLAKQINRLVDLEDPSKGFMVNNADWLAKLNYIEFLRDIGIHFSVNRMLTFECFKTRMERGLSFIEFNYTLLQSYDFLTLFREYNCRLQIGGDDQWSNIISGVDLVRRMEQAEVFGLTIPLLETANGKKMGKTEAGAVWLDPERVSPYDFFQFWRNTHDDDVKRFMLLYTFLPVAEVDPLAAGEGKELNLAKDVLAFEVTKLVHGEAEAVAARDAARALFGGGSLGGAVPTTAVEEGILQGGINILDLLLRCGLIASKSEGRRLVEQGGISVNDEKVISIDLDVSLDALVDGRIMLKKGKKVCHRVTI
jgi:tyrosyl-tRNA synthetase